MDSIDKKIKDVLSEDLNEPFSYEQKIKMALYENNNEKQSPFGFKLFKIASTVCVSVLLSSGIVFAGYNIYEKVWKEPTQYNSYQEYQADNELKILNDKINKAIEIEQAEKNDEIISEDKAIEIANSILEKTGNTDVVMTKESIKYDNPDSKHSLKSYYVIKSNDNASKGIDITLGANGDLAGFTNHDLDLNYSIEPDSVESTKAEEEASKILDFLNLKDKYIEIKIQEINHYNSGKQKKVWWANYIRNYDGITNSYEYIDLYFYIINDKIQISNILIKSSEFDIDNNEIAIDENQAINIAKTEDRSISELEIDNIEANLEFRPLNSFYYAQEQSLGTDDGLVLEQQEDGTSIGYNKYNIDSNVLRKVYNVRISYVINYTDDEPVHDWKEQFGREYYVDATTGEIIGGRWGNNLD